MSESSPTQPPMRPSAEDALAVTPPAAAESNLRIFGAELIGTAVLVLVGPGSAIIAVNALPASDQSGGLRVNA